LATLGGPDLIAADDVDLGLSTVERADLWSELELLAEDGYAVLVTSREVHGRGFEYVMEGHR